MSIKLLLLKSGEDIIADVAEMASGEEENKRVIGYFLHKPCIVKLKDSQILTEETEVQQKKNKNSSSISVRVGGEKVISATLSNETVPTVNKLSFTKDNVTNLPNFIKYRKK